jgi:DNA-binding MarR family transcriptional regulator
VPDTQLVPETIRLAQTVDRFVRRIHEQLHHRALAVDHEKVGPYGGMLLMAIAEMAPTPVQDVTLRMARDKSQITRKLQELERKGLVQRRNDPTDGRVSLLQLTPRGDALVAAFQSTLGEVVDELLRPLPAGDRTQLVRLLSQI